MPTRSTMFLMGPFKQVGRMFDERRRLSTCIYLAALVLTVVAALVFHSVRPALAWEPPISMQRSTRLGLLACFGSLD
jgi:hypothetical protein